jgi:hypothetical protein
MHKGQDSSSANSSRKLVWVEQGFVGWGCSECAGRFYPPIPDAFETVDEMIRTAQAQLVEEFASHACVDRSSRAKAANF